MPEIIAPQRLVLEFSLAANFPQESQIDIARDRLRRFEKSGECRFLELEQHIPRLNLGALAVQGFDLERSSVVGEDGADFEAAILFEENVHKGCAVRKGAECSRFARGGEPWRHVGAATPEFGADKNSKSIQAAPFRYHNVIYRPSGSGMDSAVF